jgi:hypothetical protein
MTDSELHVVYAWRSLPHYAYPSLVPEGYHPPYEKVTMGLLEEQVKRTEEAVATVAETRLRLGAPADEILDLVEELRPGFLTEAR